MNLRTLTVSLGLACLATLSGCIDAIETWTINPDGSGKVRYEMAMTNPLAALGGALGEGAGGRVDPKELARSIVRDMIEESEGLEVWSDVSYEVGKKGKVKFKGTAFFRDISKVSIGDQTVAGHVELRKTDDGNLRLLYVFPEEKKEKAPADKESESESEPEVELTDAEITRKIAETRAQWQFMQSIMKPMLSSIKTTTVIHLPGDVVTRTAFEEKSSREVFFTIGGEKILESLNTMIADDELMKGIVKSGKDPFASEDLPFDDAEMAEVMFGTEMPELTFKPGENIFDYEEELAKAKENPGPALKELVAD